MRMNDVKNPTPLEAAMAMAEAVMAAPVPEAYRVHWCYENGLILHALQMVAARTGDRRIREWAKAEVDRFVRADGGIDTFDPFDWNIDNILEGRTLFPLEDETGDARYGRAAQAVRAQLDTHPRTSDGGFWHKKIYPGQMWLDGLFMGDVFYAEYSVRTGDAAGLADAAGQLVRMAAHARDPRSGLLYHGWDSTGQMPWANPETGCSPCFWGRAMGWYMMALVEILGALEARKDAVSPPAWEWAGLAGLRVEVLAILRDLSRALDAHRDPVSGRWLQLVDRADLAGNYPEASATAMIAFALMKGARMGWLDAALGRSGRDAFERLLRESTHADESGCLHLDHVCRVAGLGGTPYRDGSPEYYLREEVVSDDYKGTGPFLYAALEADLHDGWRVGAWGGSTESKAGRTENAATERTSAAFPGIQSAVDTAARFGGHAVIRIAAGVYREKLVVEAPGITLIGENPATTIIRHGDAAFDEMPDGGLRGTFRSQTALLGADDFTAIDLTFENDAGPGAKVGQAIAAYVDGDRMIFRNCRFIGHQDTLFCGSLPEREMQPGGFTGPREHAPRINGRQYFEQCFISGDIDFIFGSATAFFERCEIQSRNPAAASEADDIQNGYITAASTPKDRAHGFVFRDCVLTAEQRFDEKTASLVPLVTPASAYLGRPWRDDAKTVFVRCRMGTHIHPDGWCDWNGRGESGTVTYAECGSETRDPLAQRITWATVLPVEEGGSYAPQTVLGGSDGWNPAAERLRSLFLIGDSTVADYPASSAPMAGWGQMLPALLPSGTVCRNHAVNGRSTKSFLDEGRFDAVLERLAPGDLLLVEFGHNDEKREDPTRWADAAGAYSDNLRRMVREARSRGAGPVLLTSVCRRVFDEGMQLRDTHGEWPEAMRQVAAELDVPLIDLTRLTMYWISRLGPDASRPAFMHIPAGVHPNWPDGVADDTHFSREGARAVADMVERDLRAIL